MPELQFQARTDRLYMSPRERIIPFALASLGAGLIPRPFFTAKLGRDPTPSRGECTDVLRSMVSEYSYAKLSGMADFKPHSRGQHIGYSYATGESSSVRCATAHRNEKTPGGWISIPGFLGGKLL